MEQAKQIVLRSQVEQIICCPECGSDQFRKNGKNKGSGTQIYWCKQCNRTFTLLEPAQLFAVNPQSEYAKDIWDCRHLGIEGGVGKSSYKLNFALLNQPWLRQTAKQYIKMCLSSIVFASAQEKLYSLRTLSRFLAKDYPDIEPVNIDRAVITDFTIYLASLKLATQTRYKILCDAKLFFDACYQNEWLDVRRYLVRQEDFPRRSKSIPRYIPEEVMQQLNEHIAELAEPVMRMVLVLQECGMRISELVNLNFNCLLQDKAGDWFLRYYQFKMKKEITIPISREVVQVIQEQQRYIRKHIADIGFKYLFCANGGAKRPGYNPVPRVMTREILPEYLNYLAKKHNICDSSGTLWHFQTHQFRHTVGTRMINNGVPQHIVQRYLGHESPEMTATYAFIHDKTMKTEIAKYQGKVVNIAGQVVEPIDGAADDAELQWFKRNIQAQALPNGSCALPTISQGCPHANACLTCTHFRTTPENLPELKKERRQALKIIEKARANGWIRQAEMNEAVVANLDKIIAKLEAMIRETSAKC
jgi:integrase/recombinase XerD